MSIRFKEISAGNFRELPVSGGYINVSNLIDIIKQKENIGEVNEIQLMNADTNEYLDKSQTLPAGSKVSYEITETGDENEEAMLKEIMGSGSAKDSNEYQKPVQQRRHVPMPMKMNDQSKHMPQKKPAPPAPTKMTEIADDLKCYICKNLLRNAVQVKCCQETFCEECKFHGSIVMVLSKSSSSLLPCFFRSFSPLFIISSLFFSFFHALFFNLPVVFYIHTVPFCN
jgi:hypothetical protein